jgi:hypothetical protein
MTLLSLLLTLGTPACRTAPVRPGRSARRRVVTQRPSLEGLEDRSVPSNLFVTKSLDDGSSGTLRNAISIAQPGDTIVIKTNQLSGPIVLNPTVGELVLDTDLAIRTSGSSPVTISGGDASRVFEVAATAHVSLANLIITDGGTVFEGGGILNNGTLTVSSCTLCSNVASQFGGGIGNEGTLTVSSSTLSGDAALFGGGLFNNGTATINGCTLSGNAASAGGGIFNNFGTLTVSGSTLSGNFASGLGGGIANVGGTLTVSGSTLSGNFASGSGGGIDNEGTLTISGSALSGNSAGGSGGAIINHTSFSLTLSGCTLSGNSATNNGGGIDNEGTLAVTNSTMSGNHAGLHGGDLYEDQSAGAVFSVTNSTITDIFFA